LNPAARRPIQLTVGESLTTVTSRLFEAGDLRALYAIEEACFTPEVRFSRALMRSLVEDANTRTWLGIAEGVRAGFAIVGLRTEQDESSAYIWTIEVLPAFRRMGVARELLARVEDSASQAGCTAIELHVSEQNLDALTLYVAAGYERVGVEPGYYGHGVAGFRYRKVLAA